MGGDSGLRHHPPDVFAKRGVEDTRRVSSPSLPPRPKAPTLPAKHLWVYNIKALADLF